MATGRQILPQSLLGSQLSEPCGQWGDQRAPRGWGSRREQAGEEEGDPDGQTEALPGTAEGKRRPRFSRQVSQTNVPAWLVPTPAHLCRRRPRGASALSGDSCLWRGHFDSEPPASPRVCGRGGGEGRLPWQKTLSLSMSF